MTDDLSSTPTFRQLNLSEPVLKVLDDVGYEAPTPIQAQIIPHVLAGRDVLGQAQTGTGKTGAFALPLLSRIDLRRAQPQVLVLAPTRELAIQVAEAFQRYAAHLHGLHVLPIYGGQDYRGQIQRLKRGVHVVVGTPGRVMDHMRKGTLKLGTLQCLVLDEADEMLRMGFIDDVQWILEQIPEQRQIALFSATMPDVIRRIAKQHLQEPVEVTVKVPTTTAETIKQRYWIASGMHNKLEALTRILEAEVIDGIIVFVRTKTATVELAEKLEARGYATAALNGDIAQNQRERTVEQLKNGKLDILVATDVAARGLDVKRISHVINFDIPYDTEAYVHRIGRTGRAGRSGEAILFVAPREKRILRAIEKATRQKIELLEMPSTQLINDQRVERFKQRISDAMANENMEFYRQLLAHYQQEYDAPLLDIAAALAIMAQGDKPLLLKKQLRAVTERPQKQQKKHEKHGRDGRKHQDEGKKAPGSRSSDAPAHGPDMELFRVEVGKEHGVKPGNIVGAIANEAGLDGELISRVTIHDDYSTVELPAGMPRSIFRDLKKVWVSGRQLQLSRLGEKPGSGKGKDKAKKKKRHAKH